MLIVTYFIAASFIATLVSVPEDGGIIMLKHVGAMLKII
jgi:hypothetical protein